MSWDDDKQDIKGEFKVRQVAPEERPRVVVHPKKEMGTAKFLTMVGLGVLGLFVFSSMDATPTHKPQTRSARDTPIHQTTHVTTTSPALPAKLVHALAAQKAKHAAILAARRARIYHYYLHPYPIKHWWVYVASTYTCDASQSLPYGMQTPIQARTSMRLHGEVGRLQEYGVEGDGDGIYVEVLTTHNLGSPGVFYFSKRSSCQRWRHNMLLGKHLGPVLGQ